MEDMSKMREECRTMDGGHEQNEGEMHDYGRMA